MPNENKVSIVPDTSYLIGIAEANLDWRTAIGELVDNAFDANATMVTICIGALSNGCPAFFEVTDNGSGCTDLTRLVALGRRQSYSTTRMGRYGVGSKDAALWIGGVLSMLRVRSINAGLMRSLSVDWKAIVEANEWAIGGADEVSSDAGDTGTSIRISPVRRRFPEGQALDRLVADLGYTFRPAIRSGRQIVFRRRVGGKDVRTPVVMWEPPPVVEHVDQVIDIGSRKARVFVGIVAPGVANSRPGITYWNEFRVVKSASSDGCGGRDTSRISGFVELLGKWPLTKNKDGISRGEDELFAAVFRVAEPLLIKAETASFDLRIEALKTEVERQLNSLVFGDPDPNEKAKRGRGESSGTVEPTGKGKKHRRAKETQPGRTFGGRRVSSLSIGFYDAGEPCPSARFDAGRILLNTANPWIDGLKKTQNHQAIVAVALHTLAAEDVFGGRQITLPLTGLADHSGAARVGAIVGHLTSQTVSLNGTEVNGVTASELKAS